MDITEFLRARLDEDEKAARAAGGHVWGAMVVNEVHLDADVLRDHPELRSQQRIASTERPDQQDYIARHDPARALREVETKRRILDYCEKSRWVRNQTGEGDAYRVGETDAYETVVHQLAAVYADHPDFDPDWNV